MDICGEITELLKSEGAVDVGFSKIGADPFGENTYAVSVVAKLSDAVIEEIDGEPTHTYFHHYRTVNAFIDRLCLRVGLLLESRGYRYIPVAASQSINKDGWNYEGRFSHKMAAGLAGLGGVGKNGLFLHKKFGPRVRLGTVLTDCRFDIEPSEYRSPCIGCDACVGACPSGAIKGALWQEGMDRSEIFDPAACSNYMKKEFKHIGRGAVCGICIKVCPIGVNYGTEKN